MIILETERLVLRRVEESDAEFMFELMNEPGWLKFIGDRGIRTLDDARSYIATSIRGMHDRHGYSLHAVVPRDTQEPAGICGLVRRDALSAPDLGFAFLERWSGRGYAREAAAAVVRHAREQLGLSRLLAVTSPDNVRSLHLLEAIGFRREGEVQLKSEGAPSVLLAWDDSPPVREL